MVAEWAYITSSQAGEPGSEPAGSPAVPPAVAALVQPVSLAREHTIPVPGPLRPLFPLGGLQQGSVVAVTGSVATTSLGLALAAGVTGAGRWVAAVGMRALGVLAAAEVGIDLGRLVLVAEPPPREWPAVVGALLGGFDLVLASPVRVRGADARRLAARLREGGPALVLLPDARSAVDGRRAGGGAVTWVGSPDLTLTVSPLGPAGGWDGIGPGHGHLVARRVRVEATGRRDARPRRVHVLLPGPAGMIAPIPDVVEPAPAPPATPAVLHRTG